MAMFQQYQGGIAPVQGMAEAGANIGRFAQQGMQEFGKSLGEGLQTYHENIAKDQILTEEAKQLGSQIQQYAQMFGDSPEHAEFSKSLEPYIEQLSKVPSQSLTQKMGTVTGVKAAFANIGQQLQVFELMRGERMKRDINMARGGVREYDEQTVPTAIVPSGKLPYFYNKSYSENEAEVVRLANEAKARGANIDLPSVLNRWRADMKANAMSRNDLPPAVKESLIKQIDSGKNLEDNIQTDESGVTNYAKEAELYASTSTSVKDQLAPPKVEPTAISKENAPSAEEISKFNEQRNGYETAIESLTKNLYKTKTVSDAEFNKMAENMGGSRYTAVSKLQEQGWTRKTDKSGKYVWVNDKIKDQPTSEAIDFYNSKLSELDKTRPKAQEPKAETPIDQKSIQEEQVKTRAKSELSKIDALIKQADDAIKNEKDIPMGWMDKASYAIEESVLDSINVKGLKELARMYISQGRIKELTPENAKMILDEVNSDSMGGMAVLGSIIVPSPSAVTLGIADAPRELSKGEIRNMEGAFTEWRSKDRINRIEKSGDSEFLKQELLKRKQLLENQLLTGRSAPKPSDIQSVQQATTAKQETQEPSYALTNQNNLSLGTTTTQVATSIESKRNDMKNFFMQKYGYIPASFEDSFKAIYPEASFKTMETPYGAFMHDGKEWKQIQIQQPKVMSNKEIAEEKAVTFGTPTADGRMDFQELVPKSGVYVRGVFAGTPTEAFKFRTEMLETANARVAVNRLIEINDMVGESMPWNAKLWGEAKALLPQIKAGLRTDIIGVGTVSNYEQQLIEEVVADPTKFWSLESSDRAKLAEIMRRVNNRLTEKPAIYGLEVKTAGQSNSEVERNLRMGRAGKSKLELDFEARGGKKGVELNWGLANKIPNALKE